MICSKIGDKWEKRKKSFIFIQKSDGFKHLETMLNNKKKTLVVKESKNVALLHV